MQYKYVSNTLKKQKNSISEFLVYFGISKNSCMLCIYLFIWELKYNKNGYTYSNIDCKSSNESVCNLNIGLNVLRDLLIGQ